MNIRSRALSIFVLVVFLWSQSQPKLLSQAEAPLPPEQVESYSASFLTRLSPELRAAAETGGDEPVTVTVIMDPGANPGKYMQRYALSRKVAGVQWAVGDIPASRLEKLASAPGVRAVVSPETFQTTEAPVWMNCATPHRSRARSRPANGCWAGLNPTAKSRRWQVSGCASRSLPPGPPP